MYFIRIATILTSVVVFYGSSVLGIDCTEQRTARDAAQKKLDEKDSTSASSNFQRAQTAYDECKRLNDLEASESRKECTSLKDKFDEQVSKERKACSSGGKNCLQTASGCAVNNSEENDSSPSAVSSLLQSSMSMYGLPSANISTDSLVGKCKYLTKSQWDDEKKTARKTLEEVKKDTEKIRKDMDEIQEKKGEKQSSIMEKMNDLVKDSQEAQAKEEKAGRDEQADAAKQTSTLMGAIRKGQSDLIRANQRKAQMIAQRAMFMIESDMALQKSKCLNALKEAYNKYMGKKTITSTITGASSNSGSGKSALNNEYQACVSRAREMRTQTMENYNFELKAIDEDIKNLNGAISDLNQELTTQKQNMTADAQARETRKTQMQESFMRSQQKLIADFQLQEDAAKKKTQSATFNLIQKQMDAAEASNTLTNIGKTAPVNDDTPLDAVNYAKQALRTASYGKSLACPWATGKGDSKSDIADEVERLTKDTEVKVQE